MATILSPLAQKCPKGMWNTLARVLVRTLAKSRKNQLEIFEETRILQPTISRILNAETSCTTRKGKQYKPFKLTRREVCRLICRLSKNFSSQQLSYACLRADCNINASDSTIARALKKAGYRRCVACP
jgi:hypothetical protein